DGRVLGALDMPWTILTALADSDIEAIHAYLQSLPPVRNLVPAPEALGAWDGLVEKAHAMIVDDPVRAGFHPRNAGGAPAEGAHPAPAQNPRADELVSLAALVVLASYLVLRRRRRRLETIAVSLFCLAVPLVYTWPPLGWMPPALVKAAPPFETVGAIFGFPAIRRPPAPV